MNHGLQEEEEEKKHSSEETNVTSNEKILGKLFLTIVIKKKRGLLSTFLTSKTLLNMSMPYIIGYLFIAVPNKRTKPQLIVSKGVHK